MPRINARNMAELIAMPAYVQLAMLTGQKYPKQGPSQFKRPFYAPAVDAIRSYYRSDDKQQTLAAAVGKVQGIANQARRDNLLRAIDAFRKSDQSTRALAVQKNSRIEVAIGDVALRASPDMTASDDKGPLLIYYNLKIVAFDVEAARRLAEITHWLCEQNEIEIPINRIELVDLANGSLHRTKTRRAATIRQMKQTSKVIQSLWDQI
jgi:hypothetical protein